MFLYIIVIEGDPFLTFVFGKELAHHAFWKKSFIYIPLIIPNIPAQFGQEFRFRYGKRDIRKAGLAFEFGSNSKAQKDMERDMAVVSAFVRQSLREKVRKTLFFHNKEDVIY
jgi:hypothetical protein